MAKKTKKRKGNKRSQSSYTPNRRQFLRDSALTMGVIAGPGRFLFGCAATEDNNTDADVDPNRTRPVTVNSQHHFDLAHSDGDLEHTLILGSKRYPLIAHDDESRALAKEDNEFLAGVPDSNLTHYAENVTVPNDAPQLYHVHAKSPDSELPIVALMGLHIPQAGIESAQEIHGDGDSFQLSQAKGTYYSGKSDDARVTPLNTNNMGSPYDCARALIYMHPELISLDGTTAALVANNIDKTPQLLDLASLIAEKGAAIESADSSQAGWAKAVWVRDDDGNKVPKSDLDGNELVPTEYSWTLDTSDEIVAAAQPVIQAALAIVKDDATLETRKYSVEGGTSSIVSGSPSPAGKADAADISVTLPKNGVWDSGQRVTLDKSKSDNKSVAYSVDNAYIRYLGINTAYYDINDEPMKLSEVGLTKEVLDTEYTKHVALIPAPPTVLGIPVIGQEYLSQDFTVDVPEQAASVSIVTGSMAYENSSVKKHPRFEGVDALPMGMTITFNIGLPTMLLTFGIAGPEGKTIKEKILIACGPTILASIIQVAASCATGVTGTNVTTMAWRLVDMLVKGKLAAVSGLIAALIAAGEEAATLEEAIPIVGIAWKIVSVAGTVALLTRTLVNAAQAKKIIDNKVTIQHKVTVNIAHDPDDPNYPAVAERMKVTATLDNGTVYTTSPDEYVALPQPSTVESKTVDFIVPRGGQVTINVAVLSDTGWVAAAAQATAANVLADGETEIVINMELKQNKVPLDGTTVYSHKEKISFEGGKRVWEVTDAPQQTLVDLTCGKTPGVCEPTSITFSTAKGQVGYAWQGFNTGLAACLNDLQTDLQLHQFQNINYAGVIEEGNPEATLQTTSCGYNQPVHLAYALLAADSKMVTSDNVSVGKHFAVVPDANGVYHVREIPVDPMADWDLATAKSWGSFESKTLVAVALHDQGGYIAALSGDYDKVEVLSLQGGPVDNDADAPSAAVLSGPGSRRGLITSAKAIAATHSGAVFLILEDGNKRVQALDADGNPVYDYFKDKDGNAIEDADGNPTSFFMLKDEGSVSTYLDMSVEFTGFVYVLSHLNDGSVVSDYRVDIYTPAGEWLAQTLDVAAARMVVDFWRNMYTLNYETLVGPDGVGEPSVSQWIPSTPTP